MSNYIYGLRITVDKVVEELPELGLYTSGGVSCFRWCEAPLSGVVDAWLDGVVEDIGPITKRGDFRSGGGVVTAEGFSVTIFNNNQFSLRLREIGISLTGLVCEVVEFVGTDDDADSDEVYTQYTGIIEDVTAWNQLTLTFNVKTARHKRRANLLIDGEKLPVTFGESSPTDGRYFKISRTKNTDQLLTAGDISKDESGVPMVSHPPKWSHFPVCEDSSSLLTLKFRIGKYLNDFPPDPVNEIADSNFVGKYVLISEGSADLVGSVRKIVGVVIVNEYTYDGTSPFYSELSALVTVQDYLPVLPVGSLIADVADNAWVDLYNKEIEYSYDSAVVDGFYRELDGVKLSGSGEIYGIVNGNVQLIGRHLCDVVSNENKLLVNPRVFNSDITRLISFDFLPCSISLYRNDHSNYVTALGLDIQYTQLYYAGQKVYGVYTTPGAEAVGLSSLANAENAADRISSTWAEFNLSIGVDSTTDCNFCTILTVSLPKLASNTKFTNIYLGLKLEAYITGPAGTELNWAHIYIIRKGYVGKLETIFTLENTVGIGYPFGCGTFSLNNLPDFYYDDTVDTQNRNFFEKLTSDSTVRGYTQFNLNVTNVNDYNNIDTLAVIVRKNVNASGVDKTVTENIRVYDAAVLIENEIDISDEVFI